MIVIDSLEKQALNYLANKYRATLYDFLIKFSAPNKSILLDFLIYESIESKGQGFTINNQNYIDKLSNFVSNSNQEVLKDEVLEYLNVNDSIILEKKEALNIYNDFKSFKSSKGSFDSYKEDFVKPNTTLHSKSKGATINAYSKF